LGHRRGSAVTTKPSAAADRADPTDPTDATVTDLKKPATANGATDLKDGNKAVPRTKAPSSPSRQRAEASLNQVRNSLERLGDTLRKAFAPPKAPQLQRSHRH
jgi:hypothetical protein